MIVDVVAVVKYAQSSSIEPDAVNAIILSYVYLFKRTILVSFYVVSYTGILDPENVFSLLVYNYTLDVSFSSLVWIYYEIHNVCTVMVCTHMFFYNLFARTLSYI